MTYGIASGEKKWTLQAPLGTNMTRWVMSRKSGPSLTKRERYLVVAPGPGRLGWVALQKTRLTGFGTGVSNKGQVTLDGSVFDVSLKTNQDLNTLANWNIEFRLGRPGSLKDVSIRGVFSLRGFKVRYINAGRGNRALKSDVHERLHDPDDQLTTQLCRVALEPFRYAKNGRTHVATEQFCVGLGNEVALKLRRHADQPFFSLE